jgi:hypothetical protein
LGFGKKALLPFDICLLPFDFLKKQIEHFIESILPFHPRFKKRQHTFSIGLAGHKKCVAVRSAFDNP